jgi:spore maturation protein CgeB/SAM-dependent methyltransferase
VFGRGWEGTSEFRGLYAGWLDYESLPDAYSSAGIVVDDTGQHAKPYGAVNSRVFDALASGALVLTDNEEGARELFDEDFPVWSDDATLRAQVLTFLENQERSRALVERYRRIVLEKHTYAHRAREIRDILLRWCEAERFSVRVGVPDRRQVDEWGDYHFARALQGQLERRGKPTRVEILPEWEESHAARTDVVVHLFGLSKFRPRPAQVNVLWVISHPDLVTSEMCDDYDLIFVASDRFAEHLRGRTSVPVSVLRQASDPERFRPNPTGPRHELLFVGNSRRVRRRIIDDLADTPFDLAVYGRDWTPDLLDPRHVRGEHVPNNELGRYYSSAEIVLNDHWDDMREHGFLSNRLYDALAAGAFVVSDHIDGIEEELDGAVVTYRDRRELHETIERFLTDPEARRKYAKRGRAAVLARHTFSHRVEAILEVVEPHFGERPKWICTLDAAPASVDVTPPVPPVELRFMGDRESPQLFMEIGDTLLRDARTLAGLTPTASLVVDIGSGYGRFAHALLRWPEFQGSYLGFDVLERHVKWCEEHLTAAAGQRFRFVHLDIRNERYNPEGSLAPTDVDFGVPDETADLVVLTSVFTHMWPDEIRHYLRLVWRMLKPTGRALATFFLMNGSQRRYDEQGLSRYSLGHEYTEFCRYMDEDDPLHVVAYDEDWVLAQVAGAGLTLARPIRLGTWCGRPDGEGMQDTLVLGREPFGRIAAAGP